MNWKEVLVMPPAMKSVVPVTAAFRAKSERLVSLLDAMLEVEWYRCLEVCYKGVWV